MAQLSDTQLVVLSGARQRPDHSVYPLTVKLPGGAATKVLGSLLAKGLIEEFQAKREDTVWREDKKRGRLNIITDFLSQVPYEKVKAPKVKLPRRGKPGKYKGREIKVTKIKERY